MNQLRTSQKAIRQLVILSVLLFSVLLLFAPLLVVSAGQIRNSPTIDPNIATYLPPEKITAEWSLRQTDEAIRAQPRPTDFVSLPLAPAPTYVFPTPIGSPAGLGVILDSSKVENFMFKEPFRVRNAWMKSDLYVLAGAYLEDAMAGMVLVTTSDGYPREYFSSPIKSGALTIVDAQGERLILTSTTGITFYFDIPGRKFVSSLTETIPTATPLPTLTPQPTIQFFTDDVADSPWDASKYDATNTNLRYFINPSNDQDWFKFRLERTGAIEVLLTNLPADYDLYVYSATYSFITTGTQIRGQSTNRGLTSERVAFANVPVDDYYVRVVGVDGASNATKPYQLRFNALCTIPDLSNLIGDIYKPSGKSQNVIEKLKEAQKEWDKGKTDNAAEKVWEAIKEVDKDAGKQDDKDDDKEKEKKRIYLSLITTFKDSAFCVLGKLGKDEMNLKAMESLRALVAKDYQQQLIKSDEVRDQLDQRLTEAQEKLVRDGAKKAVEELNKFISDVRKERDKKITASAADELTTKAQAIVDQLK